MQLQPCVMQGTMLFGFEKIRVAWQTIRYSSARKRKIVLLLLSIKISVSWHFVPRFHRKAG